MSLCNIPVHFLAAGTNQILQSSHNTSGLDMVHLKRNLRLKDRALHLLLGSNGCGKTTLLRAIAYGDLLPQDLRVHLLDQDSSVDEHSSPLGFVLASDAKLAALKKEAKLLNWLVAREDEVEAASVQEGRSNALRWLSFSCKVAGLRVNEIWEEIEGLDNDVCRRRHAESILSDLGFTPKSMNKAMAHLSGGWRMRAKLAAALFTQPDLLLLDEPTNHLDLDTVKWLQGYLTDPCKFSGTLLCVSHDRVFADEVFDEIIIFTEDHSLEYFSGNLDKLYKHADKISRRDSRQDEALQKKIQQIEKKSQNTEQQLTKMEDGLSLNVENKKYGCYQGLGVSNIDKERKRHKAARKKLDHLKREAEDGQSQAIDPVSLQTIDNDDGAWAGALAPRFHSSDAALKFAFQSAETLDLPDGIAMLEMSGVSFAYCPVKGNVLSNIDLSIPEKCRFAIAGRNGAGKSTLLGLLSKTLTPVSGELKHEQAPHLRITYFGQSDAEQLQQLTITPLEYLEECLPKARQSELLEQLVTLKFTQAMMQQPIAQLSGGERMRLAFARMCAEEPHLLILDEPTNHLDMYTIESLIDALKAFQGGVIFATHNRHLINEVADTVVFVEGGGIRVEKAKLRDKQRFNLDT